MENRSVENFASHWLTIQPSLFNFIEDEVGELDENQRLFVRVAESVGLERIAAKYGWCGNGRKPSSRLAIFKLFLMKHVWNFPTTKEAIAEVHRAPSMRRLCGWESQSMIPSESTISRTFEDFVDLRFREFRGETVAESIARRRLAEVKRLLEDTGLSIRAITAKCGFSNANHLKNLFRRATGKSMREWRRLTPRFLV